MPDTPKNQEAYPQVYNQQPKASASRRVTSHHLLGLWGHNEPRGCPPVRRKGKARSACRTLWDLLRPGDLLPTDLLQANWLNILLLQRRGVDFVSRLNKANRKPDFRRGQRLGPQDHLVGWRKPTSIRYWIGKRTGLAGSTIRFEKCGFRYERD